MADKRELSPKQQALVRALTNADSIAEAGRIAGYGTRQSAHRAYEGIKRRAPEILERIGYGEEVVLRNLAEMSHAEETKFFPHKAKDGTFRVMRQDVRALDIQLRARIELAKIHDVYPSAKVDSGNGASILVFANGSVRIRTVSEAGSVSPVEG